MTLVGWRVTDNERTKKVGVAAANFEEFKRKACEKMGMKRERCKFYVASCGTLVADEDYFSTLKPQTVLVAVDDDTKLVNTDLELEFSKILPNDYLQASDLVADFFNKHPERMRGFLKKIRLNVSLKENKTHLSKKSDHLDWFVGVEKYTTKEEFMASRAQSRMKSYLVRAKCPINKRDEYLNRENATHKKIKQLWNELDAKLKKHNYHGHYFNRLIGDKDVFCDVTGNFVCEGRWNEERCTDEELINPYSSREERTVFKSWNLDHRVELSRSIVPSILKAITALNNGKFTCCKCAKVAVDGSIAADHYFQLLFTRKNLKLVSEVCHDKKKHADFDKVYVVCKSCKPN